MPSRLLARVQVGIAINEHTDEDGAVAFLRACKMGLEGIVSKRLTAPYRSGPSRDWLKINNPQQSWGFEWEPPKAVMKDSGTRAWTLWGRQASVAACPLSPGFLKRNTL